MKNLLIICLFINIGLVYGCNDTSTSTDQLSSNISVISSAPVEVDNIIDTVSFNLKNKAYFEFPNEMSFYKCSQNHASVFNNEMNLIGIINSRKDIYYGIQMYNHRIDHNKIYRIGVRAKVSALSSGEFGDLRLDRISNSMKKEVYFILHDGKTDFALDKNSKIEKGIKSVTD